MMYWYMIEWCLMFNYFVSAHMPGNICAILERYSKPLMQLIKYAKNEVEGIDVLNSQEVEAYFRFPI